MAKNKERINGHSYWVTRDANNEITEILGADTLQPVGVPNVISKFAFRSLFTFNEKLLLDNFETNPSISEDNKKVIKTFTIDYQLAEEIDLTHPLVASGLYFLEQIGLLGVGRAQQVLANQMPT